MNTSRLWVLAGGLAILCASSAAQAVPSFARQTGLPCSACHTSYPELTQFGRAFKLGGYTLATGKQIESQKTDGSAGLRIGEIPPLSAMVQLSATHMQKQDPAGTQNNSLGFPQEASLFFAGAISNHLGAFVQMTYDQAEGAIGWDNTDVRYANTFGSTVFGLSFNNNPSVQDVWNTTPAWGFPFAASGAANAPAASTLIDGALATDVGGAGAYALFDNHFYAELSGYRSTHQGNGAAAPTATDSNTLSGLAPYWRLAWQQSFGSNYLMVGAYGINASLYPTGFGGETDQYKDYAFDTQFEMPVDTDSLTLRGTYIHEARTLDASFAAATAANPSDTLKTLRLNGSYHFGGQYAGSLGYFHTSGSPDALLYPDSASTGAPDSAGEIVQGIYLPWQNVQVMAQYTVYNKFDGAKSDYDGAGRNAADNNTLYLLLWLMW